MVITGLAHIGIAVKNLEDALEIFGRILGLEFEGIRIVEEQRVKVAFLRAGEMRIELLEPTDEEGPVARFIEKRGEGIHHLALEVNDLQETLKALENKGVQLIDREPRNGVEDTSIAFLHPKEFKVLIEIVETKK